MALRSTRLIPHLAAAGLAVVIAATSGCSAGRAAAPNGQAVVTAVVDGDTIKLHLGNRDETGRLLGIDTPETVHPSKPVECYGAEAHDRLAELTPPGTAVRLERDEEARDRYGRLLVYVYRSGDGLFVNQSLVAAGFATTLFISPNGAHRRELEAAVVDARAEGRGLWGACGGPDTPLGDTPNH
jgi:micrococcal nuclease